MSLFYEYDPRLPFDPIALFTRCIENGSDSLLLDETTLPPEFFDLSSQLLGELLHKLSVYQMHLAIVISDITDHSPNFQSFAHEANKGGKIRIFPTRQEAIGWLESV